MEEIYKKSSLLYLFISFLCSPILLPRLIFSEKNDMKKSRVQCACMEEVFCLMFLRDMDIDIGRVHKHVTGTADALEEPVLRDEMIVERDLVTKPLLQPRVLLPL